jgi:DNA-binding response OmpR family regulator
MEGAPTAVLIDDDPAYSEAVCEVLQAAGVKVHVANSHLDAGTVFLSRQLDLLILDLVLPGFDGIELIRRLRQIPGRERVPVLVVSGRAAQADKEMALAAGANGFLLKPFTTKQLRAAVRQFLPTLQTAPLRSASCEAP